MKKNSLFITLTTYLLGMLFLILILVGSVFYWKSSELFKENISGQTTARIDTSARYIEQYVSQLKYTVNAIAKEVEVVQFAQEKENNSQLSIRNWLEAFMKSNEHFVSMTIVTKDGRIVSSDQNLQSANSNELMMQEWYQQAIDLSHNPVLLPSRLQNEKYVLSISQEILSKTNESLGVVRFDIDSHALENYIKELSLGSEGYAFVINTEGKIIYHPDNEVFQSVDKQMSAEDIAKSPMDSMLGKNFFVHKISIDNCNWVLVGVSTFSQWEQLSKQLFMIVFSIAILSFVACSIGMVVILRHHLSPIQHLEETMQEVEKGQTDLRAIPNGASEFQQLAHHFNHMLNHLEQLMMEARKQEQLARVYELKALSSQINPHFLYNTLDTIIWMAEFQDTTRVVSITKALATYFRLALNGGEDLISLSKELDHVRQYLFIQQQRYEEKLSYEIQVDENIPDILLPKLVLQPLVENAIYHGIDQKREGGKISIVCHKSLKGVEIAVEDNGMGMKPEVLRSLQKQLHECQGEHLGESIGLKNVHSRLKLYYGRERGLQIESVYEQGTRVSFDIPFVMYSEEDRRKEMQTGSIFAERWEDV